MVLVERVVQRLPHAAVVERLAAHVHANAIRVHLRRRVDIRPPRRVLDHEQVVGRREALGDVELALLEHQELGVARDVLEHLDARQVRARRIEVVRVLAQHDALAPDPTSSTM